ncbi:MAG: sulfite reductase subunit A [Desulfobacteraceae bacterium]|nr:MAG: sulfite reductase subunit A [Desulfobacteraceae bacterium]
MQVIDSKSLDILFNVLNSRGFQLIGPRIRDGAIIYDSLASTSELPVGWTDRQAAGTYRLVKLEHAAMFEYAAGPHSWKKFLHPSSKKLWCARRNENDLEIIEEEKETPKYAFIGVRGCDLKAISVQDKVFLEGPFIDPTYQSRRQDAFILAANCTKPGGTCFCASMKSGPKVSGAFDLALTEILQDNQHYFLVETGSSKGEEMMEDVPHRPAETDEVEAGEQLLKQASGSMGRMLDTTHVKELLYRNLEHPRWDDAAARCLSCANCTMVCPTCFCTTVEEETDLTGKHAGRRRKWDSCFTKDFSYIHGGYIRSSVKSRYRQWMAHKLASWIDQFETSGCVGCGRCITWCPVGIDITEELDAIGRNQSAPCARRIGKAGARR